ncbi:hypothetical protein D8674_007205 [Pyrus ussuriensis x Pyrus communis]|uniref:Uncharacterized protein n=1 Tax=Pyrus ussuriensis x Pyrus communis TaxID=2448454 RepID=A0A5N5FWG8_9ROSA|nr:hypothetical protein D8674_007205 [Pyrus ussuriensis x Pyrus communis]
MQNKMSSVVNTAWDQYLKPFLLAVTVTPTQRLKLLIIGLIDRDRDSDRDLEAARQEVADGRTNNKYDNNNLDWATIIVVFCFTAAIGIAVLPFQGPSGQLHLPVIFYFLGLSVLLAFTCILVSKFIHFSYCPAGITIAPIFHQLGIFFGVTAFFISISIPFPLWFKCAALSIYVVTFLLVVLCNLHFNKYYKTHGFKYPNPAIDPAVESCGGSTSTIDDQACTSRIE